jgi:hypothetical protein
MLPSTTFESPTLISPESDFEAEKASILTVVDDPNHLKLSVTLQFNDYPAVVKDLILYESDEYEQLGDWTYDSLLARIKLYYESGMSFPIPVADDAIDIPLGTILTEEPPELDEEEEESSDTQLEDDEEFSDTELEEEEEEPSDTEQVNADSTEDEIIDEEPEA